MAIVPLLVNLARELDSECRGLGDLDHMLDDDFGFGIHPVDIFRSPHLGRAALSLHPRRRHGHGHTPYDRHQWLLRRAANRLGKEEAGADALQLLPVVGKDGFQVCMDVSQFKPNELTVKTVDQTVVVEGKHEEREDDHGVIQRHFVRKYTLPKDYDPNDVVSTVSSDGVLTVKAAPPPNKAIQQKERIVQIQQTGPAHLSVKVNEQHEASGKSGQAHNGESTEKMQTEK